MNRPLAIMAGIWLLAGCQQEPVEVTTGETRVLTTADRAPKLFATSDERFGGAQRGPVAGTAPAGWAALPAAGFRLLDYRFGAGGKGEVYVTMTGGGVAANLNRWLAQFGRAPLDEAAVAGLRRVPVAGAEGVWVEAEGTYRDAMGRREEAGYALAGVLAPARGQVLAVKMVGPAAEVAAHKAALEAFVASLQLAE